MDGAKVIATNERNGKQFITYTGDGRYSLNVASGTYTLTAIKEGCQSKVSKGNQFCAFGTIDENETLYYGAGIENFKKNLGLECSFGTPIINSFDWKQLHEDYSETPHRYLLLVDATEPTRQSLTYTWRVDCGYFVPPPFSSQFKVLGKRLLVRGIDNEVEWRYDEPGECVDAQITIDVINEVGKVDTLERPVFK